MKAQEKKRSASCYRGLRTGVRRATCRAPEGDSLQRQRRQTLSEAIISFVGLDVHHDSIAGGSAPEGREEPRFFGTRRLNTAVSASRRPAASMASERAARSCAASSRVPILCNDATLRTDSNSCARSDSASAASGVSRLVSNRRPRSRRQLSHLLNHLADLFNRKSEEIARAVPKVQECLSRV